MWDTIYNTAEYMYGTEPNQFLKESTGYLPEGRILCLGDGEGRNSVYLAKQGYDVTAVDLSSVAITKARKLANEHQVKVNYIQADLADYDPGEEQWDAVVSIFCHLPAKLRSRVNNKVFHSLKSGGIYLIEGYTPKQLEYKTGGPPAAEMMISASILAKDLPHMDALLLEEKERAIHEGVQHNGLSHVAQGILIKA